MTDDGRGADVITLPMLNLSPPGGAPDDGVPPPPEAGDLAPPPDFFLPFLTPGDDEDPSAVDPDDVAPQMIANASSGTGTPARATASMAMVTMAAIAVAALRGTWSMANYLKARREHHDAVADKAREAADKQKVANAAAGAKKGVQSGPEFGRGATGKGGGGRSGGSGAGGGSGRGTFGQQQKPSPKGGGRGSSANGSAGAGGRGTGPKGSNGAAGGGSRSSGPGSSGKGSKGAAGGGTGSSGSGKGSPSGAKQSPGTLGKLATGRQQRKNDEAKAERQAAADHRKADLADRAAARKEAAAEAADRRKRRAEKRKAKREREKAGGTSPKETGKGKPDEKVDLTKKPKAGDGTEAKKDDTEKVDLTKKPKAGDGTEAKKDDTEKVDLTKKPRPGGSKGGTKKKPKPPRKKKSRGRRKPKGSTTGPRTGRRRRKGRTTTDPGSMPGADGEWLRPPPGWDVEYKVEQIIRPESRRRQPAGSITTGRKGLPAGSSGQVTPTRSVPKESPIVMGTAVAVGEVGDTQFVDAELTVYDLIESDEEMSEQILQGVDHMNLVAAKCEGLKSGLESLYAMCIEKKVPGVLVKWCIRLMERAGSVQDKAEALRDSLPRASEAILVARDTAVEADKLRADRVKEAGHVAPAEREYHDRSGV